MCCRRSGTGRLSLRATLATSQIVGCSASLVRQDQPCTAHLTKALGGSRIIWVLVRMTRKGRSAIRLPQLIGRAVWCSAEGGVEAPHFVTGDHGGGATSVLRTRGCKPCCVLRAAAAPRRPRTRPRRQLAWATPSPLLECMSQIDGERRPLPPGRRRYGADHLIS